MQSLVQSLQARSFILIKPDVIIWTSLLSSPKNGKFCHHLLMSFKNLYSFLYFEERKQMFSTFL